MAFGLGLGPVLSHDSGGVDQYRASDYAEIFFSIFFLLPPGAIVVHHRMPGIAQQLYRQVMLLLEILVRGKRVGTDSRDNRSTRFEFGLQL